MHMSAMHKFAQKAYGWRQDSMDIVAVAVAALSQWRFRLWPICLLWLKILPTITTAKELPPDFIALRMTRQGGPKGRFHKKQWRVSLTKTTILVWQFRFLFSPDVIYNVYAVSRKSKAKLSRLSHSPLSGKSWRHETFEIFSSPFDDDRRGSHQNEIYCYYNQRTMEHLNTLLSTIKMQFEALVLSTLLQSMSSAVVDCCLYKNL